MSSIIETANSVDDQVGGSSPSGGAKAESNGFPIQPVEGVFRRCCHRTQGGMSAPQKQLVRNGSPLPRAF